MNEEYNEDEDEYSDSEEEQGPSRGRPKGPPERKRSKAVNALRKDVSRLLESASKGKSSSFATGGELSAACPLVVIQIGKTGDLMHFPVYESEAAKFIKQFEQAPFGKGEKTLVDTTVRNSWQLGPKEFTILNPKWESFVTGTVVPLIAKGLALDSPFTASLYKLLFYETGSFFKPHRDTEKEDGMFGTLVIQLPSKYSGGELLVKHADKSQSFEFGTILEKKKGKGTKKAKAGDTGSSATDFTTYFAALYCDCEHEILPVTSGYRACLVYNLVSGKDAVLPKLPPSDEGIKQELITALNKWPKGEPSILAYYLAHKYTKSSLSFNTLKTTDKHVATLLQAVAPAAKLKVYVCLFKGKMSGAAGYHLDLDEDGGSMHYSMKGRHPRPPADVEFCEDLDEEGVETEYMLSCMTALDGQKFPHKTAYGGDEFTVQTESELEVIPVDVFKNGPPDDLHLSPTGNEGTQMEKWHNGAAIVFWPESKDLTALKTIGVDNRTKAQKAAASSRKPKKP